MFMFTNNLILNTYFAYSNCLWYQMKAKHMFSPINHFFVFSFQRSGQNQGRCVCLGKDQAFYTSGVRTWQTHPVKKKWTLGLLEESKSFHGQQPVQSVVFQSECSSVQFTVCAEPERPVGRRWRGICSFPASSLPTSNRPSATEMFKINSFQFFF